MEAAYRALYRKWRSVDFDDVCGQDRITDILKYQVSEKRLCHAYLFCGSRGTGKTSCAKILAKAVNCLNPHHGNPCNQCEVCRSIDAGTAVDVTEMDAASHTGVDHVRNLQEELVFTPAELRYRVYIIDEVHMISANAFNALLKTLEEPPSHVMFILATTELHKLPSTIVSRCQRFDFRRLDSDVIVSRLFKVARAEGIDLGEDGARLIARAAQGGMRDALSLLELCAGMRRHIDEQLVIDTLGIGARDRILSIVRAVFDKNYELIYSAVSETVSLGRDLSVFMQEILDCLRDLLVMRTMKDARAYLDLTDKEAEALRTLSASVSQERLIACCKLAEDALSRMQRTGGKRTAAEVALCRMCDARLAGDTESLLARIASLEDRIARLSVGEVTAVKQPTAPIQPQKEAVQAKETPEVTPIAAQPATASKEEGDDRYFALRYWQEALDAIASAKPAMAGMLIGSRAYKNRAGMIRIRIKNAFFAGLLKAQENFSSLRAALADQEGHAIPAEHILIEVDDQKKKDDLIDDLVRACDLQDE